MKTQLNNYVNNPVQEKEWFNMQKTERLLNIKNMGEANLIQFLIHNGLLWEDHVPNQDYIDRGYILFTFSEITNSIGEVVDYEFITLFSPKGVQYIRNLLGKEDGNEK